MIRKTRCIVKLCRKTHGTYYFIKSIRLKSETQETVRYKKQTYLIHLQKPTIKNNKGDSFYYIDIDTGSQLPFSEISISLTPEELDLTISRHTVANISSGLQSSGFTIELKNLIIGSLLGAGICGFVIMILLYMGVI